MKKVNIFVFTKSIDSILFNIFNFLSYFYFIILEKKLIIDDAGAFLSINICID